MGATVVRGNVVGGTFIRQQVERANCNLLVTNAFLLILIFAGAIIGSALTGQNMFFPAFSDTSPASGSDKNALISNKPVDMRHPVKISVKDLASVERLAALKDHAVTLTDNKATDLAFPVWNWSERTDSNPPAGQPNYHLSMAQGQLFVILPPDAQTSKTYTGVIRRLSDVDENTVTTVLHSRGIKQVSLMPYTLDAIPARSPGAGFAGRPNVPRLPVPNMLLILLCAVPVWNVVKALQRRSNPRLHPIVKALEMYGPLADVTRDIDREYAQGVKKIAPVQFTASWMLVPTMFGLIVVHLDHLVWIWRQVYITQHYNYAIRMRDRQGGFHEFACGIFQIKKILDYVGQTRPWVFVGYDAQLNVDFATNRAQVVAQVDARRQQYLSAQAAPPAASAPIFPAPLV